MLTAVKVAFGFCIIFLAFEETVSWTVDLQQVRKYFFEKSLYDRERQDRLEQQRLRPQQVPYDNIHTKSLHFDYEKYKEHYADGYKYNGYMEQKVHDAVQNGSAYLDGLRRAIEAYLQRLESCRNTNMTVNLVQLRPDNSSQSGQNRNNTALYEFLTNPANPLTNPREPSLVQSAILNLLLPFSTYGLPVPTDLTTITQMNMNFTSLMEMSNNYTMFNMSDEMRDCMRADLASEHVRRLAELAVWAASELQDKLYAEKYSEPDHHENAHGHENANSYENTIHALEYDNGRGYGHGHEKGYGHGLEKGYGHVFEKGYGPSLEKGYGPGLEKGYGRGPQQHDGHNDDTLVLRLAWFLDRLAYLTSFDPKAEDFVQQSTPRPSTETPPMYSWMPTLISNSDLQLLMTCLGGSNGTATERCALPSRPDAPSNPNSLMAAKGWPTPQFPNTNPANPASGTPDLTPSPSETEYTYSEQVFTDDDMPLSLPQRPAKTKRKRSVQGDPLQNFVQYYAKYKTWTGSNQEEKDTSEMSHVNTNKETVLPILNSIRKKRFVVKKKGKLLKPEIPFPKLSSYVKHKVEVHIKKDEKEAKLFKKFFEKLHKPKTELKLLKFKKTKRSIKYSRKEQPRVPADPQMDISYYVKNKEGRTYNYNVAQALLVRAGLEQVFQTGNILVVQRYGSNYNPANREQIVNGYILGLADF